jgi:hypothetical protein
MSEQDDTDRRESLRRLRRVSLMVFWAGLVAALLSSPFNILTRTKFSTDLDTWLISSLILASAAVLALVVYLASLASDKPRQRRELRAALAGEAVPDDPIIMLVPPGDVVEAGAVEKAAERFFTGGSILGSSIKASTSYGLSGQPLRPAGEEATEIAAGQAAAAGGYDAVEKLRAAVDERALLVVIGTRRFSSGADRTIVEPAEREEIFRRLIAVARLIVLIGDPSARPLADLAQVAASPALIAKTVVIMPRGIAATRWATLVDDVTQRLGLALPAHDRNGGVFRVTAEPRVGETVALESLATGVQNYLAGRGPGADFDVERLWKAVEVAQSSIAPRSALDFARRVSETRFVEDAETLIKLLGGTVAREEGGFLAKSSITVRLPNEAKSFARDPDMVRWIVEDLAPRVESGAVTAEAGATKASP